MRVLVVGAGAVGQVYGRHLSLGGCEVGFLVKPKYRRACEAGFDMYALNTSRDWSRAHTRLEGLEVLCEHDEVAAKPWDQVWLCMSSPALRSGFLDALLPTLGSATVVTFQPGLLDRAWLLERIPAQRLITGMIPFIAWQAPLPGERLEPTGIMYWLPPLSPTPLSGPADAVSAAVSALRAGGMGARTVADVSASAAPAAALFNVLMAALEIAGWRFEAFRKGDHADMAAAAARQSIAIAGAYHGQPAGPARWVARPWLMRLATRLAPALMPFDIETYLEYHFTKVGDQTRQSVDTWIAEGNQRGLHVDALQALRTALAAL